MSMSNTPDTRKQTQGTHTQQSTVRTATDNKDNDGNNDDDDREEGEHVTGNKTINRNNDK